MNARDDHGCEARRAGTLSVFRDIASRNPIPGRIRLELQFLPQGEADWEAVLHALARAGFEPARHGNSGSGTLEAAIEPAAPTGEAIWAKEERATRPCLAHCFRPDGRGFLAWPPARAGRARACPGPGRQGTGGCSSPDARPLRFPRCGEPSVRERKRSISALFRRSNDTSA